MNTNRGSAACPNLWRIFPTPDTNADPHLCSRSRDYTSAGWVSMCEKRRENLLATGWRKRHANNFTWVSNRLDCKYVVHATRGARPQIVQFPDSRVTTCFHRKCYFPTNPAPELLDEACPGFSSNRYHSLVLSFCFLLLRLV